MSKTYKPVTINSMKDVITKPEISFMVSLIIPLIGVAVMWGTLTARLNHVYEAKERIHREYYEHVAHAEERFDEQDAIFTDIQVRLAEIQKDILYIKQNVENN